MFFLSFKSWLHKALIGLFFIPAALSAQSTYHSFRGDYLFSGALRPDSAGSSAHSLPRFSMVINSTWHYHITLKNSLGIYTGAGINNIGFIHKTDDVKIKRRVYVLSIPAGIQFGKKGNGPSIMVGATLDLPFHFKEKTFPNNDRSEKIKKSNWFSHQTNWIMPSAFLSVALTRRLTLDMRYYFSDMMKRSYTNPAGFQPYKQLNTQLVCLSFTANVYGSHHKIGKRHGEKHEHRREQIRPKKKKKPEGFKA